MRDSLAALVEALSEAMPPGTDAATVADALWLAAAPAGNPGPAEPATPPPPSAASCPDRPDGHHDDEETRPEPVREARPVSREVPLYERLPLPGLPAPDGRPVDVATGRALPHALELGRALRPFKRRYGRGTRRTLDLDATVRAYADSGELVPVFTPAPEPWFEVVVVVDTHPTMEVWRETVDEFTALLAGLGAFRLVRSLRLTVGPEPRVTDLRGRARTSAGVPAPGGRQLVLVVSDCAAPGWRKADVRRLLRDWGAATSVVLLNPLPARLWPSTGLDLPAVRVRQRTPSTHNTELTFTVPLTLKTLFGPDLGWVALPTPSLTPHALRRWAAGVMRGARAGHDAVLLPETGVLTSPFAEYAPPVPDAERRAAAFLHAGSPAAKRLAALCSPFSRLSLPLLRLIRQETVPEASVSDLAELMTSGIVDIATVDGGSTVLSFSEAARARLAPLLSRHDAWTVQAALTRYVAARTPGTGTAVAAVAADGPQELPAELRPFALASEELLAVLDGGRRRRAVRGAGTRPQTEESAAPRLPDPSRTGALLIGVSDHSRDPSTGHVDEALVEMYSVLMSPDSWDLPADRCQIVQDVNGRQGFVNALRHSLRRGDETFLLYFAGLVRVGSGIGSRFLVLGHEVLSLEHLADILLEGDFRRIVIIFESFPGSSEFPMELEVDADVYLLCNGPGPDSFPRLLRHVMVEGVPEGPELLEPGHIARAMRQLTSPPVVNHHAVYSRPPLALLRNRAAPGYVAPSIHEAYDLMRTAVRRHLGGRYEGIHVEIDRILLKLLTFVDAYEARVPAWDEGALYLMRDFELSLGIALEPRFTVTRGGKGERDLYCQAPESGLRIPIDLQSAFRSDRTLLDSAAVDRPDPLSVVVMFDSPHTTENDTLFNISPSIGVRMVRGTCLVLLRAFVRESDPWPPPRNLDDALREAVASACDDLVHSEVDPEDGLTYDGRGHRVLAAMTGATVENVDPMLGSIDWQPVEAYEHGLSLGEVRVNAELTLEGYLYHGDVHLADREDGVAVLDHDWNDHMASVSVGLFVELAFQAQIDSPDYRVELEFRGMEVLSR
ncbi:SAV_2336 N-terminal domain-related protein [Kitasatospora sp. NPDC048545]|uniref:SAV_2336 N-terminal domain-related protein n=1 Tax=Kitasatospora sp. NPDC048545 TaxID=3157208 RepID=UPI0033CB62EA